jgi:hypothetical protein
MTGHTSLPALRRTTFRSILVLFAASTIGVAAGCSITDAGGRSADALDLARNRQRWASAALHDYEFDYQLSCFCGPDATEPVHIVVQNDHIVTVVRSRDGLPAGTTYGGWPRVDELFAEVQQRLDQRVARLEVSYDATYGYPHSIILDIELMAADDESFETAGNLRPLH